MSDRTKFLISMALEKERTVKVEQEFNRVSIANAKRDLFEQTHEKYEITIDTVGLGEEVMSDQRLAGSSVSEHNDESCADTNDLRNMEPVGTVNIDVVSPVNEAQSNEACVDSTNLEHNDESCVDTNDMRNIEPVGTVNIDVVSPVNEAQSNEACVDSTNLEHDDEGDADSNDRRNIEPEHQDSSMHPSTSGVTRVSLSIVDYASSEDYSSDDSVQDPTFLIQNETRSPQISDDDNEQPEDTRRQLTRWKKRDPTSWKVNVTKQKRSMCLPYSNRTKQCNAKQPKHVNCTRCRYDCSSNFTDADREEICKAYWAMGDDKRQKDFLIRNVQTLTPKRRKVDPSSDNTRSVSKVYHLENNRGRFRVCANFFEKTLCISKGPINTVLSGRDSYGNYQKIDMRGRKTPANKTSDEDIAIVKQHIESFPCMESHYVRSSSKKKYLDANLSILKMYSLYVDMCKENNLKPVSEFVYRRVFCTSYNLSFFKPKKDQCHVCNRYETADIEKKREIQTEYSEHISRKIECNAAKENDKLRSKSEPSFITANFDLQSVLQLPFSNVSQFYYSRIICVYNLTIYEGYGKNAYCFTWNELNGKRGSKEIGSILLMYIDNLPSTVKEISLFSDTCGGQNRNQQVAAALLYAVRRSPHIKKIEMKFLESGHSHMECDSMHSAIENVKKHKTAFLMNDWLNIFSSARSDRSAYRKAKANTDEPKEPYKVQEIKFHQFKDLQTLAAQTIKNRNIDEYGDRVNWLKIKCLKFDKTNLEAIYYRYDHSSEYKNININNSKARRRPETELEPELQSAYKKLLPIQKKKKEDLEKLCRLGLIPEEIRLWYQSLPTTSNELTERLPEPDADEVDEEEEGLG